MSTGIFQLADFFYQRSALDMPALTFLRMRFVQSKQLRLKSRDSSGMPFSLMFGRAKRLPSALDGEFARAIRAATRFA